MGGSILWLAWLGAEDQKLRCLVYGDTSNLFREH